jgi:hypothetical protein
MDLVWIIVGLVAIVGASILGGVSKDWRAHVLTGAIAACLLILILVLKH